MEVTLLSGRSLTSAHRARWSELQQSNPLLESPFFAPQFTEIVAAEREDVFVAVFERDREIIGFFPFQRRRGGRGRPVGDGISDYQGVVSDTAAIWHPEELLRSCALRSFTFDGLVAAQAAEGSFYGRTKPSFQLDLSAGFDDYVSQRRRAGTRQISEILRKARRLEQESGPVRFVPHVKDIAVLHTVQKWKSEQYVRTGTVDIFGYQWVQSVFERIHRTQLDSFSGVLSALYAGDQLVAGHMGSRSATVWHHWIPAHNRAFAKYSPGLILLLRMAEHAAALGLRAFELGKFDAPYKRRLATTTVLVAEGSFDLGASARMRRQVESVFFGAARRTPLGRPLGRILRRRRFA